MPEKQAQAAMVKIDGVDYSYLPDEIKCDFISLDIFFICLPTDLVLYFKNIFSKSNILTSWRDLIP